MLIVGDVKSLEVVTAAYLSQDEVLKSEVIAGVDFHENNRVRFGLPNRTIAKIFVFKLIYGATAWGYANDGDFVHVSTSEKFWQEIIDEFYDKYRDINKWHTNLVRGAIENGRFESPTGRVYSYPAQDVVTRGWYWRPKILNYPVQGLGADLVMLARISFWNRINKMKLPCLPCSSVHDNIVVDLDNDKDLCYTVAKTLKESVEAVPLNFTKIFGSEFDLPLTAEVKCGMNLSKMEKIEC